MATKKSRAKKVKDTVDAVTFLERLVGPLTFAMIIRSTREGEELSLTQFAKKLGISRQRLCDIEQGRRSVPLRTAASWAKKLGYSEQQWVRFALQAELDAEGLKYRVSIEAA